MLLATRPVPALFRARLAPARLAVRRPLRIAASNGEPPVQEKEQATTELKRQKVRGRTLPAGACKRCRRCRPSPPAHAPAHTPALLPTVLQVEELARSLKKMVSCVGRWLLPFLYCSRWHVLHKPRRHSSSQLSLTHLRPAPPLPCLPRALTGPQRSAS